MPQRAELELEAGWEAVGTPPGAHPDPQGLAGLAWGPITLPFRGGDDRDWWFRVAVGRWTGPPAVLRFDGIATVAEAYLNGERILESASMFEPHAIPVGDRLRGDGSDELTLCCRALTPLLAVRRKPRARWRTKLVADGNLRWHRTMLLGRCPGFAPGPPVVGPWGTVRLTPPGLDGLALRPRLEGDDGVLAVHGADGADAVELSGPSGTHRAPLADGAGELRVPGVARWWPHTHGEPALHGVRLLAAGDELARRRVGFRDLRAGREPDHDPLDAGLDLHVNGVRVFARGAVWTPVAPAERRATLEALRDAGMNMVRVPGTAAYEAPAFHDLCDELGILVWQDFMFANLDYPVADPGFRATVEREAAQVLAGLAGRPSLAVLCGNSEVEQQVAMLGLDPALGRGELFGELLPAAVAASGADAVYLPSAPCGGTLPFRPGHGLVNYFGVGAYRRPLEDARRAEVRFASECLAFSNVPDDTGGLVVHDPRWKAGVPRDAGSGWDFEDVRDHYLRERFGVDPPALRSTDHDRYLELSRAVTGELMAEVLGEWRRAGSPCGGGLILWLRDLEAGAGWGVLDHRGAPKAAYHHLRRALAPVAVWTTDEGLNGIRVHVANDGPEPVVARLRLALYGDLEHRVGEASLDVTVRGHATQEHDAEALLGRFADIGWAYRFGPPAQDLVVASLEGAGGLWSQSVRFPAGPPTIREPAERLGLEASAQTGPSGEVDLRLRSRRLAYGVRVTVPGFAPGDDALCVEPGVERFVRLRPATPGAPFAGGSLTALNLAGSVRIAAA